jgi:hypothetical protein
LWAVIWTAIIAAISSIGFGAAIWADYWQCAQMTIAKHLNNPQQYDYMLNGSNLFSLVLNCWIFFKHLGLAAHHIQYPIINSIVTAIKSLVAVWFAWRMIARHKRQKTQVGSGYATARAERTTNVFYDDVSDLLSFGLLSGPTTLFHHYVLALPIILWTIVRSGVINPALVLFGCALIMCFQPHNMSYMYLAPVGLVLLALARGNESRESGKGEQIAKTELERKKDEATLVGAR